MRKTDLTDSTLCNAVAEMAQGLIDADLGGGVVKKRSGLRVAASVVVPGRLLRPTKAIDGSSSTGLKRMIEPTLRTTNSKRYRTSRGSYWPDRLNSSTKRCKMVRYRRYAMTKKPKAKSRILEAVHETASDLHRLGFIDKRKMRKFDVLCLDPIPQYSSEKIRALRNHLQVSQSVLAAVLNTSLSTVRKWEVGDKHPSGPSLKLLSLLDRKGLEAIL
jgi:putative transcriptional regulator